MNRHNPDRLLHEQFHEQARRTPDRVAVRHGDDSISYAELQARVRRASGALGGIGVGRGQMVGLHLDRSIGSVTAFLAILGRNAAVVPLPPAFPGARLREILEFARLDAIVDDAPTPLPASLPGEAVALTDLLSHSGPGADPEPGDPELPAFVLCSSGSTGTPKLIVRSHRSFFHRLEWTWSRHPYADDEVCCQKAHMTTTHGIYELFEPLLRGVPVVIVPDEETRDLERFWDTIRERRVSRLLIVPSVLRASLDMPGFRPPPLGVVVLMGEYVHPDLAARALEAFAKRTYLCSIYGSTEASSTLLCDLRESYRPDEELPLGTPLTGDVRPLVLDADLAPVGAGGSGRLYMAGTPLFTEYLGDPELTAEVFVEIPGQPDPVFDTRDQVRITPTGDIEYLGRVDQTVKIRGFRVDISEVERAVQRHPGVRQAAVVVREGDEGQSSLLAFYVPASLDRSEVFDTVRQHLPDYMVPSVLVGLDELPLTASHKVDRVRLLAEFSHAVPDAPDGRELTDTERKVGDAWARVLGHRSFGPSSIFFEVGGTSLTVFALVHRLREEFGLGRAQLPEQAVYRSPTLEALAARVDDALGGRTPADDGATPLLVTLRAGSEPGRPPFFLLASAGGTLGAYEKLARELNTTRDIIGVRDPYVWGERVPTEGFQDWVGRYVDAIRERQPEGPYCVGAYSSAGAFGCEVAWRLRQLGEEVELLALVDPLALSRHGKRSFGWWALRATWMRGPERALVRLAGALRIPALRLSRVLAPRGESANDHALTEEEYAALVAEKTGGKANLLSVSALFELNSGLPFTLVETDFDGVAPDGYLRVFGDRVREHMPEVDPEMLERIVIQYGLQIRAQHAYELREYDGRVLLVEPTSKYAGIVATLLRPYLRRLTARRVPLGAPSQREREISDRFGALVTHYRSMRDDTFVAGLARAIEPFLG